MGLLHSYRDGSTSETRKGEWPHFWGMPRMDNPPKFRAFVLANVLFIVSGGLTILSYVAYRQSNGRDAYFTATYGFETVVLGGLVEPVYQLLDGGDYYVTGSELLWLQAGEGILIPSGLGLLFYAITHHGSGEATREARPIDPALRRQTTEATGLEAGKIRMG